MLSLFSVKRSSVCLLLLEVWQQTANQKLSSEACRINNRKCALCRCGKSKKCQKMESMWTEVMRWYYSYATVQVNANASLFTLQKFKEIFKYFAPCFLSFVHLSVFLPLCVSWGLRGCWHVAPKNVWKTRGVLLSPPFQSALYQALPWRLPLLYNHDLHSPWRQKFQQRINWFPALNRLE